MRHPAEGETAVEDEGVPVAGEQALQLGGPALLIPRLSDERPAVFEGLFEARVSIHDVVARERHLRRDAHLHQQEEEIAEARLARGGLSLEAQPKRGAD